MGSEAFEGCGALTDLTINGNINDLRKIICYAGGSGRFSKDKPPTWSEALSYMKQDPNLETHGDFQYDWSYSMQNPNRRLFFGDCKNLTTVTVGPNVTKIGNVDALIMVGKLTIASKAALARLR